MTTTQKYSEQELIQLLQQKDQHAFSYLYDNYAPALYGVIYRIIENEPLAEDVLQESFVKIWNNFAQYDSTKGRLFTWLLNLSRNQAIDTVRSKGYKKQQKILADENSVSNYATGNYGAGSFDAMGIRKQLAALKPEQKIIIDMAYFDGMTQEEISKELALPLGTVKTRMRTAILELRKLIAERP